MKHVLTAVCLATLSTSAAHAAKKPPELTGLELQQIQSRDLETTKDTAFAAVMTVLQDAGYRIGSADRDTGLITGMASTTGHTVYSLWSGFGKSKKTPIVSAYVEARGPAMARVRLNFVMAKVKSTIYGAGAQDEEPILDPAIYQTAFEKINQAVFVRQAMDGPAPALAAVPAVPPAATAPTAAVVPAMATTVGNVPATPPTAPKN